MPLVLCSREPMPRVLVPDGMLMEAQLDRRSPSSSGCDGWHGPEGLLRWVRSRPDDLPLELR
jgi:hypothetical protein